MLIFKKKFEPHEIPSKHPEKYSFLIEGNEKQEMSIEDFVWNVWCNITQRDDHNEPPVGVQKTLQKSLSDTWSEYPEAILYLLIEQSSRLPCTDELDVERLLLTFTSEYHRRKGDEETKNINSHIITYQQAIKEFENKDTNDEMVKIKN